MPAPAGAASFPLPCERYQNVNMEEMCLASKTGDARHCASLDKPGEQQQFSHLYCVALASKKTSDCDRLAGAMSASPSIAAYFKQAGPRATYVSNARHLCYADVTQDMQHCAAVADHDASMLCSAEKSGSAEYCERMTDKKAAVHCRYTLGKGNQH